MISVRNIVTVDFDIKSSGKVLGDFETTVYFAPVTLVDESAASVSKLLITDVAQIDTQVSGNDAAVVSMKNYFYNGGSKLLVVSPQTYTLASFTTLIGECRNISDDFIYVAISNQLIGVSGYTSEVLQSISEYCNETTSPEKVRLLLTTNSTTFLEDNSMTDAMAIIKYCTKTYNTVLIDAALLVGAYFSQINLDGTDTIKDYAFTSENLTGITEDSASEDVTQSVFNNLVNNPNDEGYYNLIDSVGSQVVNLGGNLATIENISIHTDFGAIAVERDITYSVLQRMLGKQYLTEQGISNIKAAINSQLQRYKTNGYLNLVAQYSGEDLSITYNGVKYNVIKSGETLPQGFYVFSVPVSNISVADKQARKFTPIYVILETQDGARVVEITGEVR
ncbi:MAG: hypothetical protein RR342_01195 [Bacilli bacterium]